MKVKLIGSNELIAYLNKKQTCETQVKMAVKSNTAEMQANAQRNAPVDTGFLKRAITQEITDGGMTGKVESTAEYAPYQEYGTRYQSGTPHIRPAFHQQKDKFIDDLKEIAKD